MQKEAKAMMQLPKNAKISFDVYNEIYLDFHLYQKSLVTIKENVIYRIDPKSEEAKGIIEGTVDGGAVYYLDK